VSVGEVGLPAATGAKKLYIRMYCMRLCRRNHGRPQGGAQVSVHWLGAGKMGRKSVYTGGGGGKMGSGAGARFFRLLSAISAVGAMTGAEF